LGLPRPLFYHTSFESGQDQWTAPARGDNHWELKSGNQSHSGQMYWAIDEGKSYYHNDNYIVSEEFVLTTGHDHYFLTLWANPEMKRCDSPLPGLLDEQYEVFIRDVNSDGDFQTLYYEYDRDYPANSKGWEFIDKDHIPSSGTCELKPWEGKTVQLKISMQTDALEEPQGHGLYIDDVSILATNNDSYLVELFHDDGTAESYTYLEYDYVSLAVKYDTFFGKGGVKVVGFKFYMVDEGYREDINFRVWDDDGPDGLPGTILYELSIDDTWLPQGWNEIIIGPTYQFNIDGGYFYCGIEGPSVTHAYGVDESSSGWSLRFVEGEWYDESVEYMVRALVEKSVGMEDETEAKLNSIQSVFPNPFRDKLAIQYVVPAGMNKGIELTVFDITGKRIQILVNESQSPGEYKFEWDASNWPVGIYFIKLSDGNKFDIQKIVKL